MSEKIYSPVEAAKKVLEKCQEIYNEAKIEKAEEMQKLMAPTSTATGSVASTGGPSIASQIGFGKSDKKDKMKKELDKCGEMSKADEVQEMNPKLKSFIEKRKAKKTAKMEKMMGIGEKAPISATAPKAMPNAAPMEKPKANPAPMAAPAQSAAPVNAPKPVAGAKIK